MAGHEVPVGAAEAHVDRQGHSAHPDRAEKHRGKVKVVDIDQPFNTDQALVPCSTPADPTGTYSTPPLHPQTLSAKISPYK